MGRSASQSTVTPKRRARDWTISRQIADTLWQMGVSLQTRQDERTLFEPTGDTPAPPDASVEAVADEPVAPNSAPVTNAVDEGLSARAKASAEAEHADTMEEPPSPDRVGTVPVSPVRQSRPPRGPLIDAGWLFLIAGVVLIAFTVIIPAFNDLRDANFYRERMRIAEDHRELRLSRHLEYQAALTRGDETLVRSLAAMQLNQAPTDQELIKSEGDISTRTASPFGSLEPPPLVMPEKVDPPKSTLEKWATDDRSRLWLVAAGALLILVGLLPAARRA